jgi:hypothetical protein
MTQDAKALVGIAAAIALWGMMQWLPGYQMQGAGFVVAGIMAGAVAEHFEDEVPPWLYETILFGVYPVLVGIGVGLASAR